MTAGTLYKPIPERELVADYFDNLHRAYRALRAAFKQSSLTQDMLARLLGNVEKSQISRWLNGKQNLTLKSLSRMASAMQCALIIEFRPFDQLETPQTSTNYFYTKDRTPGAEAARAVYRVKQFEEA